jgi:hypothetical protein
MDLRASQIAGRPRARSTADLAGQSLQRLADAALAAEGAFRRLIDTRLGPAASTDLGNRLPELEPVARSRVEHLVEDHREARDAAADIWGGFGDRILDMFEDLFAQVERTGQLSFTNLFRTVAPLLADLVRRVVQIDLSGLLGEVGGLLSGASGSRGIGVGDLFGVGRSIVDLIGGVAGG